MVDVMSKTSPLSMRLDPDVKAALKRLAEKDNRTLTNYVETLIRQHVREKDPPRRSLHVPA